MSLVMNKVTLISISMITYIIVSSEVNAQRYQYQEFEKRLFSLEEIGPPGLRETNQLSPQEKQNLIEARYALMSFLKAAQNVGQDAMKFTTPPLYQKHKTDLEFNRATFALESYIISSAVTHFQFTIKPYEITLGMYVVLSVEGSIAVEPACAIMKMDAGQWKVAEFHTKAC